MIRMTSNTTPPPYVASASSEIALDQAFRAFDGNNNFAWQGFGPPALWLQFDYGIPNAKSLGAYTINVSSFSPQFFPDRTPRDWTVEGSNDLITWDVLDTRSGQEWGVTLHPTLPVERTYQCAVALGVRYQYFRINITANNGSSITCITDWVFSGSFDHFY